MCEKRKCRVCGCTDTRACNTDAGPCYWIEPELCSVCGKKEGVTRTTIVIPIAEFTIKHLIIKNGVVVSSLRMCDIGGQLTKEMKDEIRKELDKA